VHAAAGRRGDRCPIHWPKLSQLISWAAPPAVTEKTVSNILTRALAVLTCSGTVAEIGFNSGNIFWNLKNKYQQVPVPVLRNWEIYCSIFQCSGFGSARICYFWAFRIRTLPDVYFLPYRIRKVTTQLGESDSVKILTAPGHIYCRYPYFCGNCYLLESESEE
jgi:hypothetical protein